MFGSRVAKLRKDAGLSQKELAKRIGVSTSAIGMYEQDRREPSADILLALAGEFHVSLDYLLTGRDSASAKACQPEMMLRTGDGRVFNGRNPGRVLSYHEIVVLLSALLMEKS